MHRVLPFHEWTLSKSEHAQGACCTAAGLGYPERVLATIVAKLLSPTWWKAVALQSSRSAS